MFTAQGSVTHSLLKLQYNKIDAMPFKAPVKALSKMIIHEIKTPIWWKATIH